jgi:hypothetical protein
LGSYIEDQLTRDHDSIWSDLDPEFQGLRFSDNEMEDFVFPRGGFREDFDCDPWIWSRVAFAE